MMDIVDTKCIGIVDNPQELCVRVCVDVSVVLVQWCRRMWWVRVAAREIAIVQARYMEEQLV